MVKSKRDPNEEPDNAPTGAQQGAPLCKRMVLLQDRSLQADSDGGLFRPLTVIGNAASRQEDQIPAGDTETGKDETANRRVPGQLVPDHALLIHEKVDQLDAVTHGELGVLGHGQDGPDRSSRFQVFQGRDPDIEWLLML